MQAVEKVLYKAAVRSNGGRDGRSTSEDGRFDVKLTTPPELGGAAGEEGTNPEQLFAAAYSACFLAAMRLVAKRDQLPIPDDASVVATVGVGTIPNGFGIEVDLAIALPGVEPAIVQSVIDRADIVCPYSNATCGNIAVRFLIV